MSSYRYLKTPAPGFLPFNWPLPQETGVKARILRLLPLFFIFIGLGLISVVVSPLVAYKLQLWRWQEETIVSPLPELAMAETKNFINPSVGEEKTRNLEVIENADYNLIANWFPTKPVPPVKPSKVTHYTLSLPKLKIERAVVTIGGKELKQSLIQYPGTALPGEYGNTVIFGHSVLPTFYNPKDYKAIFSLIPTLQKGEKIILEYDGMQFTYEVEDYFEAKPEEIDVLEQHFDRQILSLVTCVPPGTYLRRGILRARLMKI